MLDVNNAFNSVNESAIKTSPFRMNTPRYLRKIVPIYFTDRELKCESDKRTKYYPCLSWSPSGDNMIRSQKTLEYLKVRVKSGTIRSREAIKNLDVIHSCGCCQM